MKYLSRLLKLPIEYYVVFILFLIVIGMSIYGNGAGYRAFAPRSKHLNLYNYENFQNQFQLPVHGAANVSKTEASVMQDTKGPLGIFEAQGLKAAPLDAPSLNDPVSKLKGSPECVGQSSGYSNSLGGLCLSDEVKKQFSSRGGNSSSGEMQIGM
jgi:hypothetical protein